VGTLTVNRANFSLPFSSVIVSASGSSFLKAAAVALPNSVASNVFEKIADALGRGPKTMSPFLVAIHAV
jgi:hypothetical protein